MEVGPGKKGKKRELDIGFTLINKSLASVKHWVFYSNSTLY